MAAPAAVIRELEQNSESLELAYREYLAWLRKSRIIHIAIGAIVFPALMVVTLLPNSLPATCLDMAAGGVLAWDLNRHRGGRFRGLLRFAAAAFASTIVKIMTGPGFGAYFRAIGADMASALVGITFWSGSFLLVLVFGALFGNKIEFDYDMSV